ncbi:DUF2127 domain-containing protein [Nocardia aurantiaca]|uniref:DUF2127 domain-containing protein n=1 Tax=Nocardia aurantiaca TaxID=2675850 RepID=A0A6I3KZM0_9NOCA|nr:DUF2127 domain-containing protein [Nocardia aurantiaca]MTE14428.1 DUF2127 domain-containing protein [Nocardia aurantiaca]
MDFSLWTCAARGHETYAPTEPELAARLHVATPAGESWRCLRCGDFVPGEPRRSGPADDAPEVPRGHLLRDRIIMRLLAAERVGRALVLILLGAGVLKLRGSREHWKADWDKDLPLIRQLADQIGFNPDHSKIIRGIDKAFTLSPNILIWIAVALFAYAAIQLVEAVGLWLVKRWGEYFAVVATSIFLPLEIYELTEKVTFLRAAALVVNLAAVIWLLWSKSLFGLNGGAARYYAEHHSESLMTVERAAVAEQVEEPTQRIVTQRRH